VCVCVVCVLRSAEQRARVHRRSEAEGSKRNRELCSSLLLFGGNEGEREGGRERERERGREREREREGERGRSGCSGREREKEGERERERERETIWLLVRTCHPSLLFSQ